MKGEGRRTRETETNLLERPAPETDQQSSLYELLSVHQIPKGYGQLINGPSSLLSLSR